MNLRTFGLVVAIVALNLVATVIVPTAASAESGGHFTSEVAHTLLVGSENSTHQTEFKFSPGSFRCAETSYSGTTNSTTFTEAIITPSYSKCESSEKKPYQVTLNGCDYVLTVRNVGAETGDNTVHLTCPAGNKILIHSELCTIELGPQTPSGGLTYTTVVENSRHAFTVDATLSGLTYTRTGGLCKLFLGSGPVSDGQLTGSFTLKGTNTAGEAVNITATGGGGEGEGSRPYVAEEGFGLVNPAEPLVVCSCAANSVDTATGNLVQQQTDLSVGGRGPGLELTRTYNSQLAVETGKTGPFGYGWTGTYGSYLTIDEKANTATVHQDNGSAVVFYLVGSKYVPGAWVQATLSKVGSTYVYRLPDQTTLEFNSSGILTKEMDRNGNAIALSYSEGRLTSAADDAGRELLFGYTGKGLIESVEDPMGHVVHYTYESENLASVTLPGQEEPSWQYSYNASHELTGLTDGRGNTTTTEYDASHRVKAQIAPLERKHTFEYAKAKTTITLPNGAVTVQEFNEAGEATKATNAFGTALAATTVLKYDSAFRLLSVTDPGEHTIKYTYDAEGNRTSAKDPNGNETKWTYNTTHDVKTMTIPSGETTTIIRDANGNPETIERPAPESKTQKTTLEYASSGDLTSITDPLERTQTFEYDSFGNLESVTDAAGNIHSWSYNENSEPIAEVSPRGNEEGAEAAEFTTEIERDAQGRPIKVTDPLGRTVEYGYDANGNLDTATDGNEQTTVYTYNAADERIKVKRPSGATVETEYESLGRLKSRKDGNGETTEYKRNLLGQVTEELDASGRITLREYDPSGILEKVTDAKERTTVYSYDSGNRLEGITYSEEGMPSTSFKYDKNGRVVEMVDGSGTSRYAYDQLNRLTESENGNEQLVEYKYNLGDEVIEVTYPNGESITRAYDEAGRLVEVTDWLENTTTFTYNADSHLHTTTFPTEPASEDVYAYDASDQMSEVKISTGAEKLASIGYTRDNVGQVETAVATGLPGEESTGYAYDEDNRLIEGGSTAYEYDPADNPTTIGVDSFTYDKVDQIEEGGATAYTYDSLGQRTKASPEGGVATSYGYDQAGNLISVERPKEGEVPKIEDSYVYNGRGLRVSQTISGNTAHMAWDELTELPLLISDGTNNYIYGPEGLPIEQIDSEGKPLYLHHDQQGSTVMLTNAAGESKGSYSYQPYGAVEEHAGTATTPLGYGAQYRNSSTGLLYLRARSYDPDTAQFLSVDPAVINTGARYAYSANNPVNMADPSGLDTWGYCGSVSASIAHFQGSVTVCFVSDRRGVKSTLTVTGAFGGGVNPDLAKLIPGWAKSRWDALKTQVSGTGSAVYQWSDAKNVAELEGPSGWGQLSRTWGIAGYGATFSREWFVATNGVRGGAYACGVTKGAATFGVGANGGGSYTWVL